MHFLVVKKKGYARRRRTGEVAAQTAEAYERYRVAREAFHTAIRKAKTQAWTSCKKLLTKIRGDAFTGSL